jgi:eukaryotic-like serine/threonine-protein kinase
MHRNIKPESIIVTHGGDVKLIDFSLSTKTSTEKIFEEAQEKKLGNRKNSELNGNILSGNYYTAPEMIDGVYDEKVDCWALGVLLYLLISGYLPF